MANVTITINIDNEAFQANESAEVSRILYNLVKYLDSHELDYAHSRRLMDYNGQSVGEVKVVNSEQELEE